MRKELVRRFAYCNCLRVGNVLFLCKMHREHLFEREAAEVKLGIISYNGLIK